MDRVITAIRIQKRNPQRVSIDLDGEFAFGLSRIVAAWMKVGDCVSEEKVNQLKAQDTNESAYQAALRLLNRRLKTESELKKGLEKKGFLPDQVEQILLRLRSENLLDDNRFSKSWIESRTHFHPRSKRLIKYELRNKGIADQLIDDALADSASEDDLAYLAASSYARRLVDLDWKTYKIRLCAYLARRGFSYNTSIPVVTKIWEEQLQEKGNPENMKEYENEKST
jgi:regulatory protein